jgi:hypothetical protein
MDWWGKMISPEDYDLLIAFAEWYRSQPEDEMELLNSDEVVVQFLELTERL